MTSQIVTSDPREIRLCFLCKKFYVMRLMVKVKINDVAGWAWICLKCQGKLHKGVKAK